MDKEIVTGIIRRDEKALEKLIECYGGLIKSVVKYHLKSFPQYTEECMWDIVFSLWENMHSYDSEKNSLKNWIGAVAKYKCIDYKRKHYKELFNEELSDDIRAEETEKLEAETESLLECLAAEDRELFYRYYIVGESLKEIAAKSGKTAAFFHNRLSRGRKKIRKKYGGT